MCCGRSEKPQSGAPRDLICCQGSYHNVAMGFDEYHQQDGLDSVRCNEGDGDGAYHCNRTEYYINMCFRIMVLILHG